MMLSVTIEAATVTVLASVSSTIAIAAASAMGGHTEVAAIPVVVAHDDLVVLLLREFVRRPPTGLAEVVQARHVPTEVGPLT